MNVFPVRDSVQKVKKYFATGGNHYEPSAKSTDFAVLEINELATQTVMIQNHWMVPFLSPDNIFQRFSTMRF